MSSCCSPQKKPDPNTPHQHAHCHDAGKRDWLLIACTVVLVSFMGMALTDHYSLLSGLPVPSSILHAGHAMIDFASTMWWGVVLGIFFISIMGRIPKAYFNAMLGDGDSIGGVFRAALAGLFLDLCSHGILLVAMKLYERGASTAQVMTFLIASPWNSISLTFILIALIGLKWTLLFILASAFIAIITGIILLHATRAGILPKNPNHIENDDTDFAFWKNARADLAKFRPDAHWFYITFRDGIAESMMLVRWLLLGIIIASLLRTYIDPSTFAEWFGPTAFGLLVTLFAATIIEVCSEGLAPVGSDILTRAAAPGNGFAFLMAGVSTDYTEIMALRQTTKSWRITMALPILTLPQIIIISLIMNGYW